MKQYRHWQHQALTFDAEEEARLLAETGILPRHIRLLRWVRGNQPTLTSKAAAGYYGVSADPRDPMFRRLYARMKSTLEALAEHGYLIRGRYHAESKSTGKSFSGMNYRCSKKARDLLVRDARASTTDTP